MAERPSIEETLLAPIIYWKWQEKVFITILCGFILWGFYAYLIQLRLGLGVTGMRNIVSWGVYVASFVFFIGISHAGTLVSAVLRVAHAEWRRPITRMAEVITAISLVIGAGFIIFDLGRPDRILHLFFYGRVQSPLMWDLFGITTYLTGSAIYLYVPMIPDLAILRDKLPHRFRYRRFMYGFLALGWRDTPEQRRRLESALTVMAVIIIPVAVSVHTVVSWVFAMTVRVGWHTGVLGPLFVAGAIYSGTAAIITAMYIFRRVYRLERFIEEKHFIFLGYMMVAVGVGMLYLTFNELMVSSFQADEKEIHWLQLLIHGPLSPYYKTMIFIGFFIPITLIVLPWTRNIKGIVVAAVLANLAMWMERYLIVVGTLSVPWEPVETASYFPTWVEWSILAMMVSVFCLLYTLFAKFFPIISIWEVKEEEEEKERAAALVAAAAAGEKREDAPTATGRPAPLTTAQEVRP